MLTQRSRRRLRAPHDDAGFTLTELVIAVALLGMVMTAMTAAILAALTSNRETEARLDRSNSLAIAATYFGDDVAQANDVRVSVPEESCADNPTPGTAVVQFWNRQVDISGGAPTEPVAENSAPTSRVSYVLRAGTDPVYRELHRRTCVGGVTRDVVIARYLSPTDEPEVLCWNAVPASPTAPSGLCTAADVRHVGLELTPAGDLADTSSYTLYGTTRSTK